MIIKETKLEVADNSGAKEVRCIGIPGGTNRRQATVGDVITVSIRKISTKSRVQKGKIFKAVIVRVKKQIQRPDGTVVKFDSNAVVLINAQNEMLGTRVFGPIAEEVRAKYVKIISLAGEVL